MAKKDVSPIENSSLGQVVWRQSLAFLIILVALFMIVGSFDRGGWLPVQLSDLAAFLVGYQAHWLIPVLLLVLAVNKIRQKDNLIPLTKLWAALALVITMAGLSHSIVGPEIAYDEALAGRSGGYFGFVVAKICLSVLNLPLTFLLLLTAALIFTFLLLGITPKAYWGFLKRLISRTKQPAASETHISFKNKLKPDEGVVAETDDPEPKSPKKKRSKVLAIDNSDDKVAVASAPLTVALDPDWNFPELSLLDQRRDKTEAGDIQANAEIIRETLSNFNVDVEMEGANIGPRVTQYTLKPPSGIKLSRLTSLETNIALELAAQSIRIEAPIPGKRAVGIEVPNKKSATVRIAELLSSQAWQKIPPGSLAFCIGKDISGQPEIGQLQKMPHLMLAGQTGSGKSVAINTLLTSLLYRCSPSELQLILVDPKQVELTPYNDIPHLLTPVIVEPEKCISALKWAVAEMERRLRTFAGVSKRNILEYNQLKDTQPMPFIVIVIDELADLMMMAARDVEALIVRIAQKARAAGIHLVLATQRPSVDVITGLIKANVPARIAFTVASQVDSRTIIDQVGAEKLLGQGDILFLTASFPRPRRVQGAFISDQETMKVCNFLRKQRPPQYDNDVVSQQVTLSGGRRGAPSVLSDPDEAGDEMWEQAIQVVIDSRKASTSLLQRRLRIGYARAARIVEMMEEQGIVAPADGARPRDVLVSSLDEALGKDESDDGDGQPEPEAVDEPAGSLETDDQEDDLAVLEDN